MNQVSALIVGCLGAILATLSPLPSHAAQTTQPLMLELRIPLEGVSGRIDHMAVDLKRGRLLIAELGNGTVNVVGLSAGRVMHCIGGLKEPQGVGYAMRGDLVAVADAGDGSVRIFRGDDLTPMGSLSLGDDADNVRIDPQNGMIVVGYGGGGLAMIDPERRTPVGQVPLAAHPESFQIDPGSGRAFVNLPDVRQIAVVDLNSLRVLDTWKLKQARANFPMALTPAVGLSPSFSGIRPRSCSWIGRVGRSARTRPRAAMRMTCSSTGSEAASTSVAAAATSRPSNGTGAVCAPCRLSPRRLGHEPHCSSLTSTASSFLGARVSWAQMPRYSVYRPVP